MIILKKLQNHDVVSDWMIGTWHCCSGLNMTTKQQFLCNAW